MFLRRGPRPEMITAATIDSLDCGIWAFTAELRLQSGTRCWGLEVCTA